MMDSEIASRLSEALIALFKNGERGKLLDFVEQVIAAKEVVYSKASVSRLPQRGGASSNVVATFKSGTPLPGEFDLTISRSSACSAKSICSCPRRLGASFHWRRAAVRIFDGQSSQLEFHLRLQSKL